MELRRDCECVAEGVGAIVKTSNAGTDASAVQAHV
jgi:hypothetical protein